MNAAPSIRVSSTLMVSGPSHDLFPLPDSDLDSGSGHRFLYCANTVEKGSESESESLETCSA